MRNETETDTSTVLCGGVLPSFPKTDSCVGMEYGIEAGGFGVPCGGVPLLSSNFDIFEYENNCSNVEFREVTDSDTSVSEASGDSSLELIRAKNLKGLIIAYLNINSIRNKSEFLKPLVADYIDVLAIAETKIDENFTTSQFLLDGISNPIRFDRNKHGGGLLIYVREGVPFKEISVYITPNYIE